MNKNYLIRESIEDVSSLSKKIFNVNELSLYTGLSKSWIYKLCQQRKLPHSRPNGKLLMFDRQKIQEWLLSNPVSTNNDIEQEAINYLLDKPRNGGVV